MFLETSDAVYGTALRDSTDEELPDNILLRNQLYIPQLERDMQQSLPKNSKTFSSIGFQKHSSESFIPVSCWLLISWLRWRLMKPLRELKKHICCMQYYVAMHFKNQGWWGKIEIWKQACFTASKLPHGIFWEHFWSLTKCNSELQSNTWTDICWINEIS